MSFQVTEVIPLDKGKQKIYLDNGDVLVLYKGEAKQLSLFENSELSEEQYQQILKDILGKRATKRAMHLLERQERTEKQLRDKLLQNEYPQVCIEQAINYVKSYHYIDDLRYASTYVRYHQEKESRQKLSMKLMSRGISRDIIEQALEEEYVADEKKQILELVRKKHYDLETATAEEYRKMVQYLMRRGFHLSDIQAVLCRKNR